MACGTPVVAVREGGYRDMIIHKVNGMIIDRDVDEFATSIKEITNNRNLAKKLSRDAYNNIFPYWSWDEATKRLTKYIEQLINK